MVSQSELEQIVVSSGLWAGGRRATHGFVLSPSVVRISEDQRKELDSLGAALSDCLGGLGRIAAIACNPKIGHGAGWNMVGKVFRTGIPTLYHQLQILNPGLIPWTVKVDFVEDTQGKFWIVEIDSHNKHGLGYSVLVSRMRDAAEPQAKKFPGIAYALERGVTALGKGEKKLILIYGERERFYLPEFQILKQRLGLQGIELLVGAESEVRADRDCFWIGREKITEGLLVDLPFMYRNNSLSAVLAMLYREGKIAFLIPPKPFLGSKGLLALLRNDHGDQQYEAILRSHISASSLELVRSHIPLTYFASKRVGLLSWKEYVPKLFSNGRQFVLKQVISSGTHGTFLPGDSGFENALLEASGSYYQYILQETVELRQRDLQYFDKEGDVHTAPWYTRITVLFSERRVADIDITARQDKRVHGALDCLQIGIVIQ